MAPGTPPPRLGGYNQPQAPRLRERTIVSRRSSIEKRSLTANAPLRKARVRELIAGNAMLEAAAEPILRARADLRRELAGLEKLVRRLAREDRVCRLLMTMPGVGHVIALTYTSARPPR